jgi:hypothetical protein
MSTDYHLTIIIQHKQKFGAAERKSWVLVLIELVGFFLLLSPPFKTLSQGSSEL